MASGQYEGPEGGRIRADSNNLFFFGQIVSKPEHRWSLWQKLVPDFRFLYWNSEDMQCSTLLVSLKAMYDCIHFVYDYFQSLIYTVKVQMAGQSIHDLFIFQNFLNAGNKVVFYCILLCA